METLFTITFSDDKEALDVFNEIKNTSLKNDNFELVSGIVISKTNEGGMIIREAYNMGPEGTLSGSIVGALVNVLGGLPAQYNFHTSNSIFSSLPNTDKLDLSAYLAYRVEKMIMKNTCSIIADVVDTINHDVMNSILKNYSNVTVEKSDLLDVMEQQFLENISTLDTEIEGLSKEGFESKEEKKLGQKIISIEEKKEALKNKLLKSVDNRKQAYRKSISNLELKKAQKNQELIEKDVKRVEKKIIELNRKEEELVKKISTIK